MIKVFVYGTLRKEEVNSHLIEGATCLSEQCWTNGLLYDTGYGYPAVKLTKASQLYGELYELTEEQLKIVDRLEGYTEGVTDNLYERIEQTVYTCNGSFPAYIYIANKPELLKKEIPNGDWKEYNLLQ